MTTATTTTKAPRKPAKARRPDVCRLSLAIRGVSYSVRPLASEDGRGWRLRKADGTVYNLTETPYGPSCDCGDQVWRHEGLDATGCKHLRALRAVGLIGAEGTATTGNDDDDTADASTWPAWTDGHSYSINRTQLLDQPLRGEPMSPTRTQEIDLAPDSPTAVVMHGSARLLVQGDYHDVTFTTALDKPGLLALVRKAARNGSQRSTDGPITVKITETIPVPDPQY